MDFAGKNSLETSFKSNSLSDIKSILVSENKTAMFSDFSDADNPGRESLGIINLDGLDTGRESLGISNIKMADLFSDNLPDIKITNLSGNNTSNMLNNAFLLSTMNVTDLSNVSSLNSINPSFHSASLDSDVLSRISSTSSCKSNILNEAFMDSSSLIKRFQLYEAHMSFLKVRNAIKPHRIKSLPSALEVEDSTKENEFQGLRKSQERRRVLSSSDAKNDFLIDSVFIEANHLAARIEDGSILELGEGENDMLHSIQEPENLIDLSGDDADVETDETDKKCKFIEKIAESPVTTVPSSTISLKPDEFNNSFVTQNIENFSSSKDPKEILSALSNILSNDGEISKTQKSNCQNMILNLAEILVTTDNKVNNLDDSGHSSVDHEMNENQETQVYEVLDLSRKDSLNVSVNNQDSNENCAPLNLSLKSQSADFDNSFNNRKILSKKFHDSQPNRSLIKGNLSLRNSNSSISSNENKSSNEFTIKLKLKKVEDKQNSNKGPLKATLSVNNMAKKNASAKLLKTPKKNNLQSNSKIKKTSTPVNETGLKPVAQSTPEWSYSTSPLNKLTVSSNEGLNSMKQKLNSSLNKDKNLIYKPPPLIKRHSSENITKDQETGKKFHRSYSVGEGSKLAAVAERVKERLNKSTSKVTATNKKSYSMQDSKNKVANRSSLSKKY